MADGGVSGWPKAQVPSLHRSQRRGREGPRRAMNLTFDPNKVPPTSASRRCEQSLRNISDNKTRFAYAIELFDFAAVPTRRLLAPRGAGKARRNQQWREIAGRDGGLSIYHFRSSLQAVTTWVSKDRNLLSRVDCDKLRDAGRLFDLTFPETKYLRHAIAHSADRLSTEKWVKEQTHSATYHLSTDPTQTMQAQFILGEHFDGRVFRSMWRGNFVSYELSERTLEALTTVESGVIASFFSVLTP
jgi:hypothetical protein